MPGKDNLIEDRLFPWRLVDNFLFGKGVILLNYELRIMKSELTIDIVLDLILIFKRRLRNYFVQKRIRI